MRETRKPDLNTLVYGKVPPQAVDLEEGVLGAVMLEKDALTDVLAIIPTPDVFYTDVNQKIFEAIREVNASGSKVDLLTVRDQLTKTGELDDIGGVYYLMQLTQNVVSGAHVTDHARIVMEKYMLRNMIKVAGEIIGAAYDQQDPFDLQERFITDVNRAFEGIGSTTWESISQTAKDFTEQVQSRKDGKDGDIVIKTGYKGIDEINEIHLSDVILIAARPGVGKSAFVLPMIIEEAKKGHAVGVINLEMSNTQTFGRMVSQQSDIEHYDIVRGVNVGEDVLANHVGKLAGLPIFFSRSYTMKIEEITAAATWLKKKFDVRLIVIDYLQLVNTGKSSNREQEIAKISRGLKTLAMALNITIIALSQLNRESDKRANKKPALSDLRESGSLEQDANAVILLHRDFYAGITQDEGGNSTENEADAIVAKWRNGATGNVKLRFHGSTMKFSDPIEENPWSPPPNPSAGIPRNYSEPLPKDYFND